MRGTFPQALQEVPLKQSYSEYFGSQCDRHKQAAYLAIRHKLPPCPKVSSTSSAQPKTQNTQAPDTPGKQPAIEWVTWSMLGLEMTLR